MRLLKIYLSCLAATFILLLVAELCLFVPKTEAVYGAEHVEERTGGLVAVDLDTGIVTEYRRGLLFERYFPQEQFEMKTQDSVASSCKNWYTTYVYRVDARGNIEIAVEKQAWGWLWFPFACGGLLFSVVQLYEACKKRRAERSLKQ